LQAHLIDRGEIAKTFAHLPQFNHGQQV
jgi:hypothetical protein